MFLVKNSWENLQKGPQPVCKSSVLNYCESLNDVT